MRGRSTSEVILRNTRRTSTWTETFPIRHSKFSISLNNSNQNLLSLPKIEDIERRRFSAYSDGDVSENPFFNLDTSSGDEGGENSKSNPQPHFPKKKTTIKKKIFTPKISKQQTKSLPPIVAVIPPDEDILFLTQ
jgi:hypothetical protein